MATTKACPACQAQIPDSSRFCPQCGAAQSLACAACGHDNAPGSRFCAQCGGKLGEAPAAEPAKPAPAPAAPPRAASAAERRQLTVMFCDLVGSTALSTRLDPEDLREVIAAYHKCAAEMAARFSGFVAKYMGDGVLIYFGYPEAHEADAENARARGARDHREGQPPARSATRDHQVRIGIATGLVVVGELVGSGEAQERNVVGETPNLAARLQSAAAPNSVLIDASTRRLTGDLFEYEPVDPGALKGFDGPVAAWRVLAREHHAEPLRGAARRQSGAADRPRGGIGFAAAPLAAGQGGRGPRRAAVGRARHRQVAAGRGARRAARHERPRRRCVIFACRTRKAARCSRSSRISSTRPILRHDDTPAQKRAKLDNLLAQRRWQRRR